MNEKTTLLIDGDILVYHASAAAQTSVEFEPGVWSIQADAVQACERVDVQLAEWKRELKATGILIAFSHETNWRKEHCETYKANRKSVVKPACLKAVQAYCEETYPCHTAPRLEADDVLGMFATGKKIKGRKIIVSEDKDLKTIPGELYSPRHHDKGVQLISKAQARYNHLCQTLVGDTADGYPGLPGCGPVKAAKILGSVTEACWEAVVKAYERRGFTAADALLQAQLAYILQAGDYNTKTHDVRLWTPEEQ